jgi:hypothetical protein
MKSIKRVTLILFITLRCMPATAQQWDGLTLYSNQNSNIGYLIDTSSTVVKTWTFTGNTGYSTHMMPGGTLFRSVLNQGNTLMGGGITGRIQKVDYNGAILWDYTYSSSTYCLHHDHFPLPNGNVLVISYDVKSLSDVLAAGGNFTASVWSEKIMELQPVGTNGANVVWEWKLWDHLVQNTDPNKPNYQASIVDNPQLLNINYLLKKDWVHMNGIDYNPVLDQIVFSSHALNEWYVIDHSTTTAQAAAHTGGNAGKGGDLLYRWGNPAAYNASGSAILNVTHDAHWIPENCPRGGNLTGINNKGVTSPSNKTTADQIIVPRNNYNYTISPGSAYSPATYINRKVGVGYTTNMGSVDEFPNGNQLICLATIGTIYEVDSLGNTLWTKTTAGSTPQAHRYSTCYINNAAPAQPSVTASSSTLSASAATSYQWYMNGNAIAGATLQNLVATSAGIYVVKTTDNNGCVYACSAGYTYTLSAPPPPPIDETGINESSAFSKITVYPNPTAGNITISLGDVNPGSFVVTVLDNAGRVVMIGKDTPVIDVSALNEGLYILKISNQHISVYQKITLIK